MSKRKLLLADDSITIQKVVNLTFADEGIEVIAVGDGDAAMRKFEEFLPDLVMADVNMPGMNGYEICEVVKKNDITKHIPVILLVGSFEPFDEEAARAAGADDFLTKPFQSIRQLVNKVTDFLNRPKGAAEPEQVSAVSEEPEQADEMIAEPATEETAPVDFGDSGMDDEMIETSPASGFASGFDSVPQNDTTIDYAKTQPLSADDLVRFTEISETNENAPEQEAEDTGDVNDVGVTSEMSAVTEVAAPSGDDETSAIESTESVDTAETAETADAELNYYSPESKLDDQVTVPAPDEPGAEAAIETESTSFEIVDDEAYEPQPSAIETETDASVDILETHSSSDEKDNVVSEEIFDEAESDATSDDSEMVAVEDDSSTETAQTEAEDVALEEETSPDADEPQETVADEAGAEESGTVEISEAPAAAAIVADDGDLLELPPLIDETGIRPPERGFVEPAAEPVNEAETVAETQDEDTSAVVSAFPPELIDAIAKKVAEQISAKTMSDVLPQITELVLKKMAEEKKD